MKISGKQKVVNLRIDEIRRNLIDEAANLQGKSRTEFMVEAAYREAEQTILDQKIYILDQADYEYLSRTDHQPAPKLVKLFKSKSPWEQ
ncbi:hypothetical protein Xen7305DRAFT_00015670 [Xenococcus sp. PCC 7305]|uniref:type II toxin-antitoxin system TacA family antitoxin n=1 Tax=Xenococcus sp. PCC 7305 TaxID=102125 RepID=UPI0002AC62B2|nr:DUF1778 domain-containing protein [Xenococcus sp. PCC 7305]ELS01860.1 hypothetical protein Xen7305DRAFT_00015670 [Xenococcus sp. PCC 7305]